MFEDFSHYASGSFVLSGSSPPTWTTLVHCIRSRCLTHKPLLADDVEHAGDQAEVFDGLAPTD